ncbi:MAG: 1-acyl-sn-glycerol-3-phosphate acyltransferase [Bdellovibrionota bacterium]
MIFLIVGAAFVFAATYVLLFLPGIFLRFLIWLVRRVMYRLRVKGLENIPPSGGVVLICNHVSYADWLIVAATVNRPVRFVADHAFFKNWFLRQILVRSHVIPIAGGREDPARTGEAYERIAAELRSGEVICIFPEGQITYTGKIGGFKPA